MVLGAAAAALCAFIAPSAAGSGIPEVKAYLNGIDAHSILAPSTLLVKVNNPYYSSRSKFASSHSIEMLKMLGFHKKCDIFYYVKTIYIKPMI
jgi:hypothetical protein